MNKTYCKYAFHAVHWDVSGRTAPCCTFRGSNAPVNLSATDYWNSDWLKEIRRKMLAGERVEGCNRCYVEERMSGKSMRDTQESDIEHPTIEKIHITYSNICNKTCNICRPYRSHLIGREYQKIIASDADNVWMKHKIIDQPYTNMTLDTIKFDGLDDNKIQDIKLHIDTLKYLNVDGGETFVDKGYFLNILKMLKENNRTDVELTITSNGSWTQEDLEILKDFPNVRMLISIDGINNLYELVRSPHNWDWITNKLNLLEKYPHIRKTFEVVIHVFNVHQLPEIVEKFGVDNVTLTMLVNQEYLGAHVCPTHILEQSADKLEQLGKIHNANYLRSCINKNVEKDNMLFHEFIKTMQPIKKLDYQSYIPWSFDLIK